MAQHDYNIANQSGADFRADLNNALLAIATVNSGSTEPSTTFAHQLWVDTSSSVLKIRNAADNAWVTTGVSITASNTFTGDLTGDVTGNLTGNVTGNVTGDLTGNADSADALSTARTISLSGDVVGSASFDGSANVDIDTVVQINSITLGTDTTGDYVESMSGGTGVTVTGGTGEGSTPSVAIGQAVATTDNVTFNLVTATDEFVGDIDGAVRFSAKAGEALTKGDLVYVSGVSGDVPVVSKAKADDVSKMPVFGLAVTDANNNAGLQVATFGTLDGLDTSGVSEGQILYASTTAGAYTTTKPTGESSQIQNIGKVIRSHAAAGSIKIGGAGRSNDVPNLNDGKIFIGNASNQAITSTLDTSIVVENTNLYYTTARANTDFDTRLATKDTGDLTEGSNLYYTTARVNSDFDTRLATKDTGDLTEGSNLYYTDARVNSAFDTRLATKDTDDVSEGTTNLYYTSARANTDFDTRLATKSTTDLAEGTNLYYTSARFDSAFTSKDTDDLSEGTTNLYYTTARFDSAFGNKTTSDLTEGTNLYYTDARANSAIDTRVTKAFVDALGIQASSVDANSVTLGTDTVGNYIQTVTGTANKITVSGSGSESADVTLSLPDDVQIADSLTVAGNLTVNGTLTSLDTTNLDIEDNLFQLNAGLTGSPVNDSGMLINRGTADNSIFMWDESVDKFTLGLTTADGSATGNITLNSLGTLVANLEGNVTGAVTGTVSSLSNHDTGDLAEGSNLYYTQARFDSALAAKSTSDLSEGSNFYYTDARFDTRLGTKDTDDVSEGTSNLYYTTARFDSAFGGKSTSDLSEGTNLYYTDARVQAVSINNVVEDTTPQLGGNLASNGNDILFADNDKAIFGAGSDLQIYHNGSNSFIDEVGTGILYIRAATDLRLTNADSSKLYANFEDGGAAKLYYNSALSILTTTAGAEVREGLTVGSSANDLGTTAGNQLTPLTLRSDTSNTDSLLFTTERLADGTDWTTAAHRIQRKVDTTKMGYIQFGSGGSDLVTFGEGGSEYMRLDGAGKLGLGTSSPARPLHISGTTATQLELEQTSASSDVRMLLDAGGTSGQIQFAGASHASIPNTLSLVSAGDTRFVQAGQTVMHIDSAGGGRVGIGTTSPSSYQANADDLVVATAGHTGITIASGTSHLGNIHFADGTSGDDAYRGFIQYEHTANYMRFATNASEAMRIDSSGKVHIGATSGTGLLNVDGGAGEGSLYVEGTSSGSPITARLLASDGGAVFFGSNTNHDLRIQTNGTNRMAVTGAGNVGIGQTSPAHRLEVKQNSASASPSLRLTPQIITKGYAGGNTYHSGIGFSMTEHTAGYWGSGILSHDDTGSYGNALTFYTSTGAASASPTEKMRLDSSGRLLVNQTAASAASAGVKMQVASDILTTGSLAGYFWENRSGMTISSTSGWGGWYSTSTASHFLYSDGANRASIGRTSGTYTALSDVNKKKDFEDSTVGLAAVMQLKPKKFRMLEDADDAPKKLGFIAQDVEHVIPEAYVEDLADDENEETFIGLTDRPIIAALTKAIQEQQTIIDDLKTRIEALEG